MTLLLATAAHHAHGAMAAIEAGGGGYPALLGALFLAGLAGGLTHCAGMCGPFVLAQVAADSARTPAAEMSEWTRARGAMLVPYHLGRFTTYGALGGMAAFLVRNVTDIAPLRPIAALLLALAAAAFLLQALGRAARLVPSTVSASGVAFLSRRLSALAQPLIARSGRPGARYLLGVVLGFLPCGLLYGALAAAAAAGSAAAGALAMAAFALGTVPALVAVGFAGDFLLKRFGAATRGLAAFLMLVNAAVLAYLAVRALG
jgi:sulfite exporter TauE/SafE